MLNIKTIPVGFLETNCYLVTQGENSILIDPGDDAEKILKEVGDKKIDCIVLTHLHFDHIGAVRELISKLSPTKAKTHIRAYCNKEDKKILDTKILDIGELQDIKKKLKISNIKYPISIIPTPGHTPGSICLYFPKQGVLFSGDTIFKGSVGVTHFKGGNHKDLINSIEEKLFTLPEDTTVYPGHGESFRLGDEKEGIKSVLYNSF